jgi:hypothetical protein
MNRLIRRLAPALLGLGLVIGGTAPAAHASVGGGNQWAESGNQSVWVNAWNGGPYIETYNNQTYNNDFSQITNPTSNGNYAWLQLTNGIGSDAYEYECISDNNNSPTSARAALNYCDANNIPWGANFILYACTDGQGAPGYYWYNVHWHGYLGGGTTVGSVWYLNDATPQCLVYFNAN